MTLLGNSVSGDMSGDAEFDPIPWFTDQHAREAAERMKAWAQGQADTLGDARWCDLTDAEWLNLARVCFEIRPKDESR